MSKDNIIKQTPQENIKENKMGTEPVPRLLISMGIPMILSMVLQACYNIVDSIFVSRMPDMNGIVNTGEYAMNALTLAFPIQMLMVAFGVGTGVGVNALLAKSLGQKNTEKVAKAAGNGIALGLIIYVCFLIFGIFGINFYLKTQTTDATILSMGNTYLKICTFFSFGIIEFAIFEKLLQSTGKTIYATIGQIAGAITNIILDPILIYGLLGLPAMGVAGAAYATIIGQILSMALDAFFHFSQNKEVPFSFRYLKPEKKIIQEIYRVGLPAIIMQALMSFMTYGVNIIFGAVSTAAVTAYGIFYKIQQFIFFAGFGLRDAITPIVSFNYGKGSRQRVNEGIRFGTIYTEIIMIAGIVVLELFATPLANVFGLSDETAVLCARAMHIIAVGFIFAGANIALQGVFQALGCGMSSLVVSLLRLLIIVLPLAWLFTKTANPEFMIWFAFPIAEFVACVVAVLLMVRTNKQVVSKI